MYWILLRSGKYDFLPELFEILDEDVDKMSKVLTMFSGVTISFPTLDTLEKYNTEIKIYARMRSIRRRDGSFIGIGGLESEFDMDRAEIHRIYKRVGGFLNESGIRI